MIGFYIPALAKVLSATVQVLVMIVFSVLALVVVCGGLWHELEKPKHYE